MKRLVTISTSLEFLFKSIELILNVKIDGTILNRILDDCEQDQVNEKNYRLNSEKDTVKINALVEEYEPETIFLIFENMKTKQKIELEELFEDFQFAFGLGASYRSLEESLAIYQKGRDNK